MADASNAARDMQGVEKVAALLLAIGQPLAGRLLQRFDASELKQLTRSAASLDSLSPSDLDVLIDEFGERFAGGADLSGSLDGARNLLAGSLSPDKVSSIMADAFGTSREPPWAKISALPEALLADWCARQHPQLAAFVLSRVESAAAAGILGALDDGYRATLVRRTVQIGAISATTMGLIERIVEADLLDTSKDKAIAAAQSRLVDIVNKLDRGAADALLDALADSDPELAEQVRARIFNFEDIVKLSERARLTLFDAVPTERVILALKGAASDICEIALGSLGARARRMVEQELKDSQPAVQRDVIAARRLIAETVLDLARRGEIELAPSAPVE